MIINKNKRISDEMFELGMIFAKNAKEATSLKAAEKWATLSEKTLRLSMTAEMKADANDGFNLAKFYFNQINEAERAKAFTSHIAMCKKKETKPLTKAEFFELASRLGFKTVKRSGFFWFVR